MVNIPVIFSLTRKKTLEPRHDKTNKISVRPAKTQISLGIRPVWSESLLCAQWVAKGPSCFQADSEDSDQTGRMPRLIWGLAGRTATLLVLSCRGSLRNSVFVCYSMHYWPFQGDESVVVYSNCQCSSAFCLSDLLFNLFRTLWSSVGKKLPPWLFTCAVFILVPS